MHPKTAETLARELHLPMVKAKEQQMKQLIQDVSYALRKFRQSPGLVLAAIVTLALGVGVNTAIFSIADGICLRPLPIPDPSHLVAVESLSPKADAEASPQSSYSEYMDIRSRVPAFSGLAAYSKRGVLLNMSDGWHMLPVQVVSDNYFEVVGNQPELGHLPTEAESQTTTIILGHRTWMELFGGDRGVIGRTVRVNQSSATVAAVLPADFHGLGNGMDNLIEWPGFVQQSSFLALQHANPSDDRTDREFSLFGRLAVGATLEKARAQLHAVSQQLAAAYPQANAGRELSGKWNTANPMMLKLSLLLLALSGAVLLIACTNIANLLLALNDTRRREMAMRMALGASRSRLLRQLLTEYLVLAAVAVAGALCLAWWLVGLIPGLIPNIGIPLAPDLRIDHRVMAFTAALSLLSVLICGVIPGLAATRCSPLEAMRAPDLMTGKLKITARKLFVIAQVAVSLALLTASGLFLRTLLRMESAEMGFNRNQNAVLFTIALDGPASQQAATFATLVDRIKALPGVTGASVARVTPFALSGTGMTRVVLAPGEAVTPTAGSPVLVNQVDEAYFRTMGISLLQGRGIGRQDKPNSERVAVINRTLARKLFGDASAIGRHLRINRDNPIDLEIVGVVQDGKYNDVTEQSQPYFYLPITQDSGGEITLIATTASDPNALLLVARKVLKHDFLIEMSITLKDQMRLATYLNLMEAEITACLGGLALLLCSVGLFGVLSYTVSRRTREIGIRMALGAARGQVFGKVLADGLKLVLVGILFGLVLAELLGYAMSSLLYEVKPTDPITLLSVTALMIALSTMALIGPARRALRIEPMDALREE
jgi:predicted permease